MSGYQEVFTDPSFRGQIVVMTAPMIGNYGINTADPESARPQVAGVIAECALAKVPLKFTAGLHHPLRRHDSSLKTQVHGFLNVFVAGVLAAEHQLPETTLRELLQEESPQAFRFNETGVEWRQWHAGTAEIELARRYTVTSFGSCSFEEPRDDLRALGWI